MRASELTEVYMREPFLKPEDLTEFEAKLDNNHDEDAYFLARCECNGQPTEDGYTEIMSIRFTYAECLDDLESKKFKQIKFWLDKDMAVQFAEAMYKAAVAGKAVN
jgi:hypothetical protein